MSGMHAEEAVEPKIALDGDKLAEQLAQRCDVLQALVEACAKAGPPEVLWRVKSDGTVPEYDSEYILSEEEMWVVGESRVVSSDRLDVWVVVGCHAQPLMGQPRLLTVPPRQSVRFRSRSGLLEEGLYELIGWRLPADWDLIPRLSRGT